MSGLLGALITGVDGMNVTSTAMGVIGTNIANTNTVGYKANVERFATIVNLSPSVGSTGTVAFPAPFNGNSWGSVQGYTQQLVSTQGMIQASAQASNLAINGRGFFPVASSVNTATATIGKTAEVGATRKGDFTVDKNGFLQNVSGYYLLGAALPNTQVIPAGSKSVTASTGTGVITSTTALNSLVPIQIQSGDTIAATATTQVSAALNLPADTAVGGPAIDESVSVLDAKGNSYDVTLAFTKIGLNQWKVTMAGATGAELAPSLGTQSASLASTTFGTVTPGSGSAIISFDSSGKLTTTTPFSLGTITSAAGSISTTFNLAGDTANGIGATTQLDSEVVNFATHQNGTQGGNSRGYVINSDGVVVEQFSNGVNVPRYQIPLVNYVNPDGLETVTGDFYVQSDSSGAASLFTPQSQPGLATIESSALEGSNVELTDEFSNMIVTQRDFSANSKVITTVDDMYSTLTHLSI